MGFRATLAGTPAKAYIAQNGCRVGLIPGVAIGGRFRANGDGPTSLLVEVSDESSNLLFDTLADWNSQLKHAGVTFDEVSP